MVGGKRPGAGAKLGSKWKKTVEKEAAAKAYMETLLAACFAEKEAVIKALFGKAKAGDVHAIKEIHDRLLGRVKENVDLTTGGEKLQNIFMFYGEHDRLKTHADLSIPMDTGSASASSSSRSSTVQGLELAPKSSENDACNK